MRFAVLGKITYVDAVVPSQAALGPEAERPCVRMHHGVVLEGGFALEGSEARHPIEARTAFHVPGGGPPHRHAGRSAHAGRRVRASVEDLTDLELRRLGLEPVTGPGPVETAWIQTRPTPGDGPDRGGVRRPGLMDLTVARFGERGGFDGGYCDAAHWGTWSPGTSRSSGSTTSSCSQPAMSPLRAGSAGAPDARRGRRDDDRRDAGHALESGARLVPWRRQGFTRARRGRSGGGGTDGLQLAGVGRRGDALSGAAKPPLASGSERPASSPGRSTPRCAGSWATGDRGPAGGPG